MYMLASPILTLWPPMRILEVMQTLFHCQAGESTTLNHLQKASKEEITLMPASVGIFG